MLAAAERYDSLTPGRGREFRIVVEEAIASIKLHPASGAPHLQGTRRTVLPRFPYSLVYVEEAGSLWIVAVSHHRRREGYWLRRLRSP